MFRIEKNGRVYTVSVKELKKIKRPYTIIISQRETLTFKEWEVKYA